jgi:hypothetical protein
MKSIRQVEIKKPCHENWEAMKPNEKGRFCNSCQTTVIDFTTKTPKEITSILSATSNQHTCGHFNRWDVKTDNKIDKLIWKLNTKGFRYTSLLIMSALILFGCRTRRGRTQGMPTYGQSPRTLNEIEISKDSIK